MTIEEVVRKGVMKMMDSKSYFLTLLATGAASLLLLLLLLFIASSGDASDQASAAAFCPADQVASTQEVECVPDVTDLHVGSIGETTLTPAVYQWDSDLMTPIDLAPSANELPTVWI